MPELVEVEISRRQLAACIGFRLGELWLSQNSISLFKFSLSVPQQLEQLVGYQLSDIQRRGKFLYWFFESSDFDQRSPLFLKTHMGMSGKWEITTGIQSALENSSPRSLHDHLEMVFTKSHQMIRVRYHDPRRFGQIDLEADPSHWHVQTRIPDPLSWESSDHNVMRLLQTQLAHIGTPIKHALLNQDLFPGIGNYLASEILFRAGISPQRKSQKITDQELIKLVSATSQILQTSLELGGLSLKDFFSPLGQKGLMSARLAVYGKDKEPCPKCQIPIRSQLIAGRNTFWCARCQK